MTAVEGITVRALTEADSLEELTHLLNRAYAPLAAMGLRYTATYQDAAITRERIEGCECYVLERAGRLVGTVTFRDAARTQGCPHYDKAEVASFGQFGIEPSLQAQGLGRTLLAHVEDRARVTGAKEVALDTAEPAEHLIWWYTRLGYEFVEYAQWPSTNYRSVILSKRLDPERD